MCIRDSVQGGTSPYAYLWDDNPVLPQTSYIASNLDTGIYMVLVTDMRGCEDSLMVDLLPVVSNMNFAIYPSSSIGNSISCYGANDGAVHVYIDSTSSLVEPYTYQWFGPLGFTSSNDSISNLSAGNYALTITDVNNCVVTDGIAVVEPSELLYSVLSTTPSTCLGACDGLIELDITGGVYPYDALVTDNNTGLTALYPYDSLSSSISGLCTSTFMVEVKDANDCFATLIGGGDSIAVLSSAIPTTLAHINPIQHHIPCHGDSTGSLTIGSFMSSPYNYTWTDLNTSSVTVSDSLLNLPVGTYVLSALYTDSFPLCTTTDTITITQISAINSSATIIDVSCYGENDGSISTLTAGGTSPYTYSWSTGDTIEDISNLTAGNYTLSIIDANGCDKSFAYTVTEPSPLQLSISASQTYILNASASGGTPPYSYSWRRNGSVSQIGMGISYTVGIHDTYYVILTDANGCTITSNSICLLYTSPSPRDQRG